MGYGRVRVWVRVAAYSPGVLLGTREHLTHLVRGRGRVNGRVRGRVRVRVRVRGRGRGRGRGRVKVRVRRRGRGRGGGRGRARGRGGVVGAGVCIWRTSCSTASREVVERLLSSWLGLG